MMVSRNGLPVLPPRREDDKRFAPTPGIKATLAKLDSGYRAEDRHAAELARRRVAGATSRHALTIALRSMERADQVLARSTWSMADAHEIELARLDLTEAIHIARCALKQEASR